MVFVHKNNEKQRRKPLLFYKITYFRLYVCTGMGQTLYPYSAVYTVQVSAVRVIMSRSDVNPFFSFTSFTCASTSDS